MNYLILAVVAVVSFFIDRISNPNVLVLQNGSTSFGWAEGITAGHGTLTLDRFLEGSLGRAEAKLKLETLFRVTRDSY